MREESEREHTLIDSQIEDVPIKLLNVLKVCIRHTWKSQTHNRARAHTQASNNQFRNNLMIKCVERGRTQFFFVLRKFIYCFLFVIVLHSSLPLSLGHNNWNFFFFHLAVRTQKQHARCKCLICFCLYLACKFTKLARSDRKS